MYKLILIDDEPIVLEGIKKLVNWEKYNIDCIGAYANGIDGFESIIENIPHIVITDIKMPGMSGLSLIEKVKSIYPQTIFVIISAYSDFQFAQKAISLNVVEYLLKPITLDKIENTIEKISSILKDQEYLSKQKQTRKVDSLLNQSFELPEYHAVCVVICQLEKSNTNNTKSFGFIKNRFEFYAKAKDVELIFDFNFSQCVLVLHSKKENLEVFLSSSCFQEIRIQCNQYKINYCSGVGDIVDSINISYEHAVEALKYSLFTESLDTIYFDKMQILYQNLEVKTKSDEICYNLKEGNKEEFLACAVNYIDDLKNKNLSQELMNHYLLEVIYSCLKIFKQNNLPYEAKDNGLFIPHLEISKNISYSSLREWFLECVLDFYLFYWKYKSNPLDPILEKAIDYINKNYHRNIGLFDVAEHVNMNASYFSVFFKAKCNISFIKYITNVRMKVACELLKQGEKVYNVSNMVGYPNYRYFCELFKKYQGITPQQYKKSL